MVRSLYGGDLGHGARTNGNRRSQGVEDVSALPPVAVADFDGLRSVSDIDLTQFADPRQGELMTRWDMITTPPDILVTNYSMLNAMLMRDVEEPMFEATRVVAS